MRKICLAGLSAVLFSAGALAEKPSKADVAALAYTPEVAASILDIDDDPFKKVITVSSKPFYVPKGSSDQFLRAFIDRKTGDAQYQLYVTRTYGGSGWRFYRSITAIGPDGPVELKSDRIGSDVDCSRYGCSYYEVIVGDVDASLLKAVSQGATAGTGDRWLWKLFSQYSNTFDGDEAGLYKTEVAGLLLGVEAIQRRIKAGDLTSGQQPVLGTVQR
jgi:hypothetical protein